MMTLEQVKQLPASTGIRPGIPELDESIKRLDALCRDVSVLVARTDAEAQARREYRKELTQTVNEQIEKG